MTEPAAQNQDQNQDQQQQQQQQQQDPQQKKNSVQERISKLYGQLQEERENHSLVAAENEQLRTQLLQLQDEVNGLKAGAGAAPTTPFGGPTAVQQYSGDVDIKKAVAEAVKEAVGPIGEAFKQRQAREALIAQQQQSLQRALAEFPELSDPNSELFQTADQIMRRDKVLAQDPMGPQRAAYMARGLLSERAEPVQQPTPQQRAAAASSPVGTGPVTTNKQSEADQIRQELDEARKQLREADGPDQQQLWVKVNKLRSKLTHAVAQQNQ